MLYQCVVRSACLCLSAMALSQWRGMGVGDITALWECLWAWITSNAHDYSVMWLRLNQPRGRNHKWQSTNPRASNVILLVALRELWGAPKDLSPVDCTEISHSGTFTTWRLLLKKQTKKNRNSLCPVMSPAPSALLEKSLHSEKGQLRKWHPPQSG